MIIRNGKNIEPDRLKCRIKKFTILAINDNLIFFCIIKHILKRNLKTIIAYYSLILLH
jgi:hypothetical protein